MFRLIPHRKYDSAGSVPPLTHTCGMGVAWAWHGCGMGVAWIVYVAAKTSLGARICTFSNVQLSASMQLFLRTLFN